MHSVDVLWSSGADITVPEMHRQFCAHNEYPLELFPAGIASHHVTSFTHTECSLNHQHLLSPVSCTMSVRWITSLCCLTSLKHNKCSKNHQSHLFSYTMNVSWDGVAIRIRSLCYISSVSRTMYVCPLQWGCYQKHLSPCLSYFDSVHACSECPLMQRCCERSPVTAQSQFSCIQQCLLNGAAGQDGSSKHRHLSSTMFSHTHTIKCTMRNGAATKGHRSQHCLVNSPFLYTMKGDITHRRPLPSHTNSPSWWFTHVRSKPLAQSSVTTGAVTVCLLTFPSCAQWTACWCRHCWFATDRHTPHGQLKDAVHSPCECAHHPLSSQSGQHPHSLMLNGTVQARSPHTPWSAQGCRALPCECAHQSRFPIRANTTLKSV